MTSNGARSRFRERVLAYHREHPDEFAVPEQARGFVRSIMQTDPGLIEEWLAEEVHAMTADVFRGVFGYARNAIYKAIEIDARTGDVTDAPLPAKRPSVFAKWVSQWTEHVPGVGNPPLLKLTTEQLDAACETRLGRLIPEAWRYEVLRRLRSRMLPGEVVEDRFTTEDLVALVATVHKELNRGSFRLKLQPVYPVPSSPPVLEQVDGRRAKGSKNHRRLAAS